MDHIIQGDHSGSSQPPVDMKTKVAFKYNGLILKHNFSFMSMVGWKLPEWSPCTCVKVNATNPGQLRAKPPCIYFIWEFIRPLPPSLTDCPTSLPTRPTTSRRRRRPRSAPPPCDEDDVGRQIQNTIFLPAKLIQTKSCDGEFFRDVRLSWWDFMNTERRSAPREKVICLNYD